MTATNSHAVAVTATERLDGRGIRDLSWELEKLDIDLLVAPGVVDIAGPRLQMRPVAGLPLIHVEKPQYHGAKRFQKRLFDIVFSGSVVLVGLPILVVVGLAVKLTSKGPVFYRQERIGLDGHPFEMIKFRTMVDGADTMVDKLAAMNESEGGVLFKIREDPRVTRVGRILATRLPFHSAVRLPSFKWPAACERSCVSSLAPQRQQVAQPGASSLATQHNLRQSAERTIHSSLVVRVSRAVMPTSTRSLEHQGEDSRKKVPFGKRWQF